MTALRSTHELPPSSDLRSVAEGILSALTWPAPARSSNRSRTGFPPLSKLELFVTSDCNLRCDYCYIEGKRADSRMSTDIALRGIDLLMAQSADKADLHLFFIGGEPLMEFDLIKHAVHYAESVAHSVGKRITFSTTTNGTLLSEERVAFLQKHGFNPLISIDGKRGTHDRYRRSLDRASAFDAIAGAMPSIRRHFPRPRARMTIHPRAASQVVENVSCVLDMGFHSVGVAPAIGANWSDPQLDELDKALLDLAGVYRGMRAQRGSPMLVLFHEVIKHAFCHFKGCWGCGAGMGRVTVAPNGKLFGCTRLLGCEGGQGILSLGDVWGGLSNVQNHQTLVAGNRARRPKCLACEYRDSCCGGCYATNYQETGEITEPAPHHCKFVPIYMRCCRAVWPDGPPPTASRMPKPPKAKRQAQKHRALVKPTS